MSNKLNCPICESSNVEFLFQTFDRLQRKSQETFDLYNCRECNTISFLPQLSSSEMHKYYSNIYGGYEDITSLHLTSNLKTKLISRPLMYLSNITPLINLINRYHKSGCLLEIGCNGGNLLYALKKEGWECYGVEMDKNASLFCQNKLGLNVQNDAIENIVFGDNFFDVIILSHVFEHLLNPNDFLERIKPWLKDDGIIVMTVPNGDSRQRNIFGLSWCGYDVPRHYYTFSRKSFDFLIIKHNLVLDYCNTVYGTYSGFLTSLLIIQKDKSNYWLNILIMIFTNQLVTLFFMPLCFVIDRLGCGEALTLVLQKDN